MKLRNTLVLVLAVASFVLRAGESDDRERLLAALPANVSFIYIEPEAVMSSGFVAGLQVVKDDNFIRLLKTASAFAEITDAVIIFGNIARVDGEDSRSGCLVISPCDSLAEFEEKATAAEKLFMKDKDVSCEKTENSGIELEPHLFLFGNEKVKAGYSAAGFPEDLKNKIDRIEDYQMFGFVENQALDDVWFFFGIELERDRIRVYVEANMADDKTAEALVGISNAKALALAGMLKVKDPALAERYFESFSCVADGRHIKSSHELETAGVVAVFDMIMPIMSKALDRAMEMAVAERTAASSSSDEVENKNPKGGK